MRRGRTLTARPGPAILAGATHPDALAVRESEAAPRAPEFTVATRWLAGEDLGVHIRSAEGDLLIVATVTSPDRPPDFIACLLRYLHEAEALRATSQRSRVLHFPP